MSFTITLFTILSIFSTKVYSLPDHYTRQSAGIMINEVMASNSLTITDEDGQYHDWIEIYNPGSHSIDLSGYGLSDNFQDPMRWIFPQVTLKGGEYLLVWASGKDRNDPLHPLHTNFSISSAGEEVLLSLPDGTLIDFLEPVEIPTDISTGRLPGHWPNWYFFDDPTPGGDNNTTPWQGILPAPVFSHQSGFYDQGLGLEISSEIQGATIYYTLDGSYPDPENTEVQYFEIKTQYPVNAGDTLGPMLSRSFQTHLYQQAVELPAHIPQQVPRYLINTAATASAATPLDEVFEGNVIRALAVKEGYLPSAISTASYFIQPGIDQRFSLPVVSFSIPDTSLFCYYNGIYVAGQAFDNWRLENPDLPFSGKSAANWNTQAFDFEREISLEFFSPNGLPLWDQNLGMRIHGGWSRNVPKKSFRLYARNTFDTENVMAFEMFPGQGRWLDGQPLTEFKRILFRAGGHTSNLLADPVCHILMMHSNVGVQRVQPVIHFINGTYWGIMNIRDRHDRYHIAYNFDIDPNNVIIINSPWKQNTHIEDLEEGIPEDLALINQLFEYASQNDLSKEQHYEIMQQMLDIDSYLDYLVMFMYLTNVDWGDFNGGTKHFRFWRSRNTSSLPFQDGRWRVMVWDFDYAMRLHEVDLDFFQLILSPENPPSALLLRLMENDDFRIKFINRFADHMNTSFRPERSVEVLNNVYATISDELPYDTDRWRHNAAMNFNTHKQYLEQRPAIVRRQILEHFRLQDTCEVTLKTDPSKGTIRINSISIDTLTPGVIDPSHWTGTYFKGVAVELKAVAAPGMIFSHWEGLPEGTPAQTTIMLQHDTTITAHFWDGIMHYWHFNDLPQGYLDTVAADFSHTGNADITYKGFGPGYIDRCEGTTLNSHLEQNAGYGLRARNPAFSRNLIIRAPSTYQHGFSLSYAVKRTANGAQNQTLCFSADAGKTWKNVKHDITIESDFMIVSANLYNYPETWDNPHLMFRIGFSGEEAHNESGNNRIDNLVIKKESLLTDNLQPHDGQTNNFYKFRFNAFNGVPPLLFEVTEGELPPGLWLSPEGVIQGKPSQTGTFCFTIRVSDQAGSVNSRPYCITIYGNDLLHFWHFNNSDDTAGDTIYTDHSIPLSGRLYYKGSGTGYLDHTQGTQVNAWYEVPAGNSLRVRNPSATRELRIEAPGEGYYFTDISFAVQRTANGARWQKAEVSVNGGTDWIPLGLPYPVSLNFRKKRFNLSKIPETENNPHLMFRILFLGEESQNDSGNNRFDNIALRGRSLTHDGSDKKLIVFPNPVSGNKIYLIGSHNIALYDMMGRRILSWSNVRHIDLPDLVRGVYILRNDKGETAKVVVP